MLGLLRDLTVEGGVPGAAEQGVAATAIASWSGLAGSSDRMKSAYVCSAGQSMPSARAVRCSRVTASGAGGGSVRRMPIRA